MKKIIMLLLPLFAITTSKAQFKPVEQGSTLKFNIKNLGFNVEGIMSGFEGNINFDLQNPAGSSFDVTVNTATVNTANDLRDKHLKDDSFFDVKNYPRIRLVSAKIAAASKPGTYVLNGQVTIKGHTKPIAFPFTAALVADQYVFKGSFKLNRKDFDVGGTSTVANELEVMLNVTAKKS